MLIIGQIKNTKYDEDYGSSSENYCDIFCMNASKINKDIKFVGDKNKKIGSQDYINFLDS